ncbi:Uncharacterised protein [Vibrio cholerae]|nr:Uncharacterised protein [Vibrio cholerae]
MHDQQTSVSNLPDNKPASGQVSSAFAGIDAPRTNMTTRVSNRRYVLLSFFMNKLLCWNFFYFKREPLRLNKRWGDLQIKALL